MTTLYIRHPLSNIPLPLNLDTHAKNPVRFGVNA